MRSVLLVGCGGHSRSLIELIESSSDLQIFGLVGLPEQVGISVLGHPVIGCDDDLSVLRMECSSAILAIGQLPNPISRQRIAAKLDRLKFEYPLLVSHHAVLSRYAQIGRGTSVGHGVIVNSNSIICQHCILNSQALIEHDVQIGDFCHISTGTLINGGVKIGNHSFIGSGTIIREGIKIPPKTILAAGKTILHFPPKENLK